MALHGMPNISNNDKYEISTVLPIYKVMIDNIY